MINKILETVTSYLIYGINVPSPLIPTTIYSATHEQLGGFRKYTPYLITESKTYYELNYFLEMLYEGKIDAWDVLMCSNEIHNYVTDFFLDLKEENEVFMSSALADSLLEETMQLYDQSVSNENLQGFALNKTYEDLGYNTILAMKAFVRAKQLDYLIENKSYKTEIDYINLAEALFDGRITYDSYSNTMDILIENFNKTDFTTVIKDSRNLKKIHEKIWLIRKNFVSLHHG